MSPNQGAIFFKSNIGKRLFNTNVNKPLYLSDNIFRHRTAIPFQCEIHFNNCFFVFYFNYRPSKFSIKLVKFFFSKTNLFQIKKVRPPPINSNYTVRPATFIKRKT